MTRRVFTIVAIAGWLSVTAVSEGGQPANPCTAQNPCAATSPSAAPQEVSAQKAGPQTNVSATGRSPLLDLPVSRTGQILLGP